MKPCSGSSFHFSIETRIFKMSADPKQPTPNEKWSEIRTFQIDKSLENSLVEALPTRNVEEN